jgi:phosphomannomutase
MIPWLLVCELLCRKGQTLSSMLEDRIAKFPSPGEINSHVIDPKTAIDKVFDHYVAGAKSIDKTDGISLEFDDWRFNLRMSNTEPVVRLNVESRNDQLLVAQKTTEVLNLLNS